MKDKEVKPRYLTSDELDSLSNYTVDLYELPNFRGGHRQFYGLAQYSLGQYRFDNRVPCTSVRSIRCGANSFAHLQDGSNFRMLELFANEAINDLADVNLAGRLRTLNMGEAVGNANPFGHPQFTILFKSPDPRIRTHIEFDNEVSVPNLFGQTFDDGSPVEGNVRRIYTSGLYLRIYKETAFQGVHFSFATRGELPTLDNWHFDGAVNSFITQTAPFSG